jgi:hypothetical protein
MATKEDDTDSRVKSSDHITEKLPAQGHKQGDCDLCFSYLFLQSLGGICLNNVLASKSNKLGVTKDVALITDDSAEFFPGLQEWWLFSIKASLHNFMVNKLTLC